MTTYNITLILDANGWDGEFDTIRHAVAVATKHHLDAIHRFDKRMVDYEKGLGKLPSSVSRRRQSAHCDALEHLNHVSKQLSKAWKEDREQLITEPADWYDCVEVNDAHGELEGYALVRRHHPSKAPDDFEVTELRLGSPRILTPVRGTCSQAWTDLGSLS